MKVNLQQKEDEEHYRGRLFTVTVHSVLILMALNEQRFRTHKYFVKKKFPLYLVLSKLVLGHHDWLESSFPSQNGENKS